ncbi:MAG: glycosyltransferase family 1 protein [Clostridia bacterium]|nr:glycosyltransferase family 1 protein [Clostridia bacterium]
MKKVLFVHGGLLTTGGTEAVMMNLYRNISREKVQIDFLLHGFGEGVYDDEILGTGGEIFHVVPKGQSYSENTKQIKEIISNGKYDVVHSHIDAGNAHVLKIAKDLGVPTRVSHSHNTATQTSNPVKKVFNSLEKKKIAKFATHLLACSDLAGKWLYGDEKFTVINNAINVEKFIFSQQIRNEMREKLNIADDVTVIGNVGRFSYQKNHEKIIEIFNEFLKNNSKALLMLIGSGETKSSVETMVKDLGIENNVLFIEPNNEINRYMQAMDCFLMPSRFEGLPVVTVEAQSAGLPIILSDTVSQKTAFTDLVEFVALGEENSVWCDAIQRACQKERTNRYDEITENGYNIVEVARRMQEFYLTGEMVL